MHVRSCAVAAAVLLAGAGAAWGSPGAPQLRDPRGDWPVPSGDVLSLRLSTQSDPEQLVVDLELAAPPTADVPQSYNASFGFPGCRTLVLAYYWSGATPGLGDSSFADPTGCSDENSTGPVVVAQPVAEVTAAVRGSHVIWRVRLAGRLRRGATVRQLRAYTATGVLIKSQSGGRVFVDVIQGDDSSSNNVYVVGR
jgi:hypothetical protein